jgi:rRNA maturation endonuclease Nob1
MKVWLGYGTEHSQNLVMIGHFKDVADAERAEEILNQLEVLVNEEVSEKRMEIGKGSQRFSDRVRDVLYKDLKVYDLGPSELEQFAYDVRVKREGANIVITTDESDVSAFLKLLIDQKAKVEVYSAHFYPDSEHGRHAR